MRILGAPSDKCIILVEFSIDFPWVKPIHLHSLVSHLSVLTSSCCLSRSLYCFSRSTLRPSRSPICLLRSFMADCIFFVSVTRVSTRLWSLAWPVFTSWTCKKPISWRLIHLIIYTFLCMAKWENHHQSTGCQKRPFGSHSWRAVFWHHPCVRVIAT